MEQSMLDALKLEFLKARKAQDRVEVAALSSLIGDLETLQKKTGKEITDEVVLATLTKHLKGLMECLNELDVEDTRFEEGKRQKSLLEKFKPGQLSKDEVIAIVEDAIKDLGDSATPKNLGAIMKLFKTRYPGKYDGKYVSQVAKDYLKEANCCGY